MEHDITLTIIYCCTARFLKVIRYP